MRLSNQIFAITSHETDLLFSFLLPHFFSSIHVQAGGVSANSAVALPSAFCKPLPLCHSSAPVPHSTTLAATSLAVSLQQTWQHPSSTPRQTGSTAEHQCSSHRSMVVALGTGVPGQGFPLTLPALLRDTGSFDGQDLLLWQHSTYWVGPLLRTVTRNVIKNQGYRHSIKRKSILFWHLNLLWWFGSSQGPLGVREVYSMTEYQWDRSQFCFLPLFLLSEEFTELAQIQGIFLKHFRGS